MREIIEIRNHARVIEPQKGNRASLGSIVTTRDDQSGAERRIRIGSYMMFGEYDESIISYNAPLARMLIGGKVGDTREAVIGGKKKVFYILKVE